MSDPRPPAQAQLVENTEESPARLTTPESIGKIENSNVSRGGNEPLPDAGHEAAARWLATPKAERKGESTASTARRLGYAISTFYSWFKLEEVIARARFLTGSNKALGDLVSRREWVRIVEGQVGAAKDGDTQAAKFCQDRAWPEDRDKGGVAVTIFSLPELIYQADQEQRLYDEETQRLEEARQGKVIDVVPEPPKQLPEGEGAGEDDGKRPSEIPSEVGPALRPDDLA